MWVDVIKEGDIFKSWLVGCECNHLVQVLHKSSPTATLEQVRFFLAHALQHKLIIDVSDITKAYMNVRRDDSEGDIVVLCLPAGAAALADATGDHMLDAKVNGHNQYLLVKGNLYGLQDSGRVFWDGLKRWFIGERFTPSMAAPTIFYRAPRGDVPCTELALTYVDDVLTALGDQEARDDWFEAFCVRFPGSGPTPQPCTFLGTTLDIDMLRGTIKINTPQLYDSLEKQCPRLDTSLGTPLPDDAQRTCAVPDGPDNPIVDQTTFPGRSIIGKLS